MTGRHAARGLFSVHVAGWGEFPRYLTKHEVLVTKHYGFAGNAKGIVLTFDEYQADCFAAGPQVVEISAVELKPLLNARLPRLWWPLRIGVASCLSK